MAKVTVVEEFKQRQTIVETFNFMGQVLNYNLIINYKPGLSPRYDELFNISKEMLPQLIDVLQTMQKELDNQ